MTDDDLHVLDRVMQIALLVQADFDRTLAPQGLTSARTHLLWELHRLGPSTQQRLATALDVSARNVTGLVDALEAGGFVRRRPHPSDRRATHVTLTELGTTTMATMQRDRLEFARRLAAGFDTDELATLRRSLDVLAERLGEVLGSEQATDQGAA